MHHTNELDGGAGTSFRKDTLMKKALVRGIFAVAFIGLSLTGLLGVSIHGHDMLGQDNSATAMMKQDPGPCPVGYDDKICSAG